MTDESEPKEREPTEDELIDFMDWLIDHKLADEQIDMARIEVTLDAMEKFTADTLGPATGEELLADADNPDVPRLVRWWEGAIYVVDLGDVRLLYRPA